jgi:hypothetical protein
MENILPSTPGCRIAVKGCRIPVISGVKGAEAGKEVVERRKGIGPRSGYFCADNPRPRDAIVARPLPAGLCVMEPRDDV